MEEAARWPPSTSAKVGGTDRHRQAAKAHLPLPTLSLVSVYLRARLLPGPERGGRGHSQQSVGSLSARVRSVLRPRAPRASSIPEAPKGARETAIGGAASASPPLPQPRAADNR